MDTNRELTVERREREIFRFLKELAEPDTGATAREIFDAVQLQLADHVSIQAYYKVLDRLVASGRLESTEGDGTRRYAAAKHLTIDNAITLDDVYAIVEELAASDAIAKLIDAREYFERRRNDTLRQAAEALLEEDPRELMWEFLRDRARDLAASLEVLKDVELADRELEHRVSSEARDLAALAYRNLGLSEAAIGIPSHLALLERGSRVSIDEELVRAELGHRVFGARCIERIAVDSAGLPDMATISGSDGSSHASALQLATASTYMDEGGHQVVTFNNSVVFVRPPTATASKYESPFYSVPMTRSAIEDRSNKGMVLAPFMYRYLSEAEYEHMAKCATDVVQWRADEQVFAGKARSLGEGKLLPRPTVHFRDGTITPQEREWNHYQRLNEYGEMVREGIALTRAILDRIAGSDNPPVFAGAVKVTQTRLFSSFLSWFIVRGSGRHGGPPIDAAWDMTRAAHIADNETMTHLLASLVDRREAREYFVTFAVMRPFASLTEFFRKPEAHWDWVADFRERQARAIRDQQQGVSSDVSYLGTVSDVADDDFVRLCQSADYVSFYVGHTAGDPPPVAPRYEFLESLREMSPENAAERVLRNRALIVAALDRTRLSHDREHNFLSRKMLVRVIPSVIYRAHEMSKALGRKLESEVRSVVVANLQALRSSSIRERDVQFRPVSIRRYVERFARSLDKDERDHPDR